jgi:hypothetical protein
MPVLSFPGTAVEGKDIRVGIRDAAFGIVMGWRLDGGGVRRAHGNRILDGKGLLAAIAEATVYQFPEGTVGSSPPFQDVLLRT